MTSIDVTAFVSYSWDDDPHKDWVRDLASRLRADGVFVTLDQWHAAPGDQLPEFMERSIRDSRYVLIICTPGYCQRADGRKGGVGYEGDIITGELFIHRNHRKFIPVLRNGDADNALPSWLKGKYFIDLRGTSYSEAHYQDLLATLFGARTKAPPVGPRTVSTSGRTAPSISVPVDENDSIRITGIIADKVTTPRMDGTAGSALYEVPFRLSRRPSYEWAEMFIEAWNHPSQFTSMHRPGIADVEGDIVWLRGTRIEEVERYHRDTLLLAVKQANLQHDAHLQTLKRQRQAEIDRDQAHRNQVNDAAGKIKFD